MNSPTKVTFQGGKFSHNIFDNYLRLTTTKIKILIVVDGSVQFVEGAGGGFGVGRVIRLLRETRMGCTEFLVDIATRSGATGNLVVQANPGTNQAKYSKFRFDSNHNGDLVIDDYHEIFLFGFSPDNAAQSDANITNHPWNTTDNELEVLETWMNNGGGIFATGDHDYLGASMCHRIARVGTMRKWTNADGVPPIGGSTRIDTNQAVNANQSNGISLVPGNNQRDATPQPIEWVIDRSIISGLYVHNFPHEVLCHPSLGVINVMPDHPHEGVCNEIGEINLNATVKYGTQLEYPTLTGYQPRPKVIAYGNVTSGLNHAKGPVNSRRFAMISVYDGRENNPSNTGRVVVDSTWHHWMDMNINDFESATDLSNWNKISRYYLNIAKWIAPKNVFRQHCWWEILATQFDYVGVREISPKTDIFTVGGLVHESLKISLGPCAVKQFSIINICDIVPEICRVYVREPNIPGFPLGPQCLSCPPFELLENLVLGSIYRKLEPVAEKIKETIQADSDKEEFTISIDEIQAIAKEGVVEAIKRFTDISTKDLKEYNQVLKGVKGALKE